MNAKEIADKFLTHENASGLRVLVKSGVEWREVQSVTLSTENYGAFELHAVDDDLSGWKPGPLPDGTWNYGAVIGFKDGKPDKQFCFARFCGNQVITHDGTRLEASEVAFYNNSIVFPFLPKSQR